ncbi:hypothetical protein FQN57_006535 [Myotisia sp. PD_48]|nr:hypothetical protein FQN57_006535 [Myotisia sp. PD_48]
MTVKRFPFPLNIGTDIVHIPRLQRLVTRSIVNSHSTNQNKTYLDRFIRRILCEEEKTYFHSKFQSLQPPSTPTLTSRERSSALQNRDTTPDIVEISRWLAGRFAAKEAARKAAPGGASSLSWKDVMVQVESQGGGRPEVVYLRNGIKNEVGKLSISHDGEYVVATVLAADNAFFEEEGKID